MDSADVNELSGAELNVSNAVESTNIIFVTLLFIVSSRGKQRVGKKAIDNQRPTKNKLLLAPMA
jgi:hypothetical protein